MMRVMLKLLLILVLAFTGVKIWYGRLEERLRIPVAAEEREQQAQEEVVRTEIARKPDDYSIIVDRNIFQAVISQPEQVEEQSAPEEMAPTQLKLSLMGTISGAERDARAIIADDLKKQQDIYHVGDSIQGALIKTIERGRVVLEVNGEDEELMLKEREGGGPAYEPSPADFYQEPEPLPEPEVVESVEPVEEGVPPIGEPGEQQMPGQTVQQQPVPGVQTPNEPVVRPRPLRRPIRMPDRSGSQTGDNPM